MVLATFQKVRWVQAPKELTLSVLRDVSRRIERNGHPTRRQEVQGTAADLQATASAADPFNLDAGWLAGWLAGWADWAGLAGFSWIFMDFH